MMQNEKTQQELQDRLDLIQNMINEGRRKTESWGWTFLLWGLAYFVAIFWASKGGAVSIWGRESLAWPVTMVVAVVLTIAIGIRKGKGKPETTLGRAIVSIWCCVGTSMLLIFPSLAISGRLDEHAFVSIVASMLAVANGASGLMSKWRMQIVCAVVWWITSVAACFGSLTLLTVVFLAALFLCQIVFGTYAMMMESRRRRREIAHA